MSPEKGEPEVLPHKREEAVHVPGSRGEEPPSGVEPHWRSGV